MTTVASAEPGPWRTDRAPYQRGILDAISDPRVESVRCMAASQVGKTEMLLCTLGYYVHQDPSPIMVVLPTIQEAEHFSKTRLAPMLRDTPVLASLVREPRTRDSGNTLLLKEFPGGHITLVGANSPSGLAAKPIRVLLRDEIDRYPESAGAEGDPIALSTRRTTTFWNRKLVDISSPTLKGFSRIEQLYLEGDQRKYHVACPRCGTQFALAWSHIRWDDNGSNVHALSPCCNHRWGEQHKMRALRAGRWVATNPAAPPNVVSFHLPALLSVWAQWEQLVREWLLSQRHAAQLQVFVNTILAETYEERATTADPTGLLARTEVWEADAPNEVVYITAGVDVQEDRLEVVVRGWGRGFESWGLLHHVIPGDPHDTGANGPWRQLEELRLRAWQRADGRALRIAVMCIDSGYATDAVYAYCRPRWMRGVYATKGSSNYGAPIIGRRPTRTRTGARVYFVGPNAAKDLLAQRLRIAQPGPYCMHWHAERGFDATYFQQLTSEKVKIEFTHGHRRRVWVLRRGERNEALDCEVLALAGLYIAQVSEARLAELERQIAAQPVGVPEAPPNASNPTVPSAPVPARPIILSRRSWLKPWGI